MSPASPASPPSASRRLVGSAGGVGRLPGAPGTWASLATVLLAGLLLGMHGLLPGLLQPSESTRWATLALLLVLGGLGVAVGNHARADWGREDPGEFVLDEVVGQGLALLPLVHAPLRWQGALAALLLFRVFDVLKPPPCGRLERLPGGVGIMADDVAAGLYAMAGVTVLAAVGWLPGGTG